MIRAYLFALDPTEAQADAMASHCGATRVAYNWCLARVKANWSQRAAEQTYGLTGDQLTPWMATSAYGLRKAWNAAKNEVAPWWKQNSKEAYASGCANLAAALANRTAGRAKMPRFKSKRTARMTCKFTTGQFGLVRDRRHVQLPVIGVVRTSESTRKLARKIEAGTARIRSATLSYQRGRWHVSFSVDLPDTEPAERTGGRVVGVDLGISHLATLSTGEQVQNQRRLDAELRNLRRAERACARRLGPDRRTGVAPSNRWKKARARADRIHTRVANLRRDDTHQFTTRLVREFDTIVIEDLHVAGMLRNRRLARHIAGVSWGQIRRQLTYKTERAGVRLVVADRWFASSKTCSECGTAKAKLPLNERVFACLACGIVLDRDENAARNLAALAVDTGELRRELPDGSDVRRACSHAPQSHRHGKSPTGLNATTAR
ncbi:transposase [Rhodococcus sp. ACS1]|uniref:IS607 family element RNA-guided endonuclease TnpB n=1 Tax=Rhodococcus sp. ACS1 TaxID=2028570 RepID=UPI000BB0D198|nr:IS607 family element RNA-guided endonuclease TnpB [Rhodococcus sp. ACS1]PBC47881.1 transposase [Rhodococcus sp. ACS1]